MEIKNYRNILIVGRTGSGKSSLANTLLSQENFAEIFKEGNESVSTTRESQEATFDWNNINYRIVDTIGLSDTKLSSKEVFFKVAETIGKMKEGITYLLFLIKDKFSEEERERFKIIRDVMLESGIVKHTTIVRTNFHSFKNQEKVERDINLLLQENEEIAEIINSCNGIVHINNPSIRDFEEEDGTIDEISKLFINKKKIYSRTKILNHLEANYHDNYKLKSWDKIYLRINKYLEKKEDPKMTRVEIHREKEIIIKETALVFQQEVPKITASIEQQKDRSCCIIS